MTWNSLAVQEILKGNEQSQYIHRNNLFYFYFLFWI